MITWNHIIISIRLEYLKPFNDVQIIIIIPRRFCLI